MFFIFSIAYYNQLYKQTSKITSDLLVVCGVAFDAPFVFGRVLCGIL